MVSGDAARAVRTRAANGPDCESRRGQPLLQARAPPPGVGSHRQTATRSCQPQVRSKSGSSSSTTGTAASSRDAPAAASKPRGRSEARASRRDDRIGGSAASVCRESVRACAKERLRRATALMESAQDAPNAAIACRAALRRPRPAMTQCQLHTESHCGWQAGGCIREEKEHQDRRGLRCHAQQHRRVC